MEKCVSVGVFQEYNTCSSFSVADELSVNIPSYISENGV